MNKEFLNFLKQKYEEEQSFVLNEIDDLEKENDGMHGVSYFLSKKIDRLYKKAEIWTDLIQDIDTELENIENDWRSHEQN